MTLILIPPSNLFKKEPSSIGYADPSKTVKKDVSIDMPDPTAPPDQPRSIDFGNPGQLLGQNPGWRQAQEADQFVDVDAANNSISDLNRTKIYAATSIEPKILGYFDHQPLFKQCDVDSGKVVLTDVGSYVDLQMQVSNAIIDNTNKFFESISERVAAVRTSNKAYLQALDLELNKINDLYAANQQIYYIINRFFTQKTDSNSTLYSQLLKNNIFSEVNQSYANTALWLNICNAMPHLLIGYTMDDVKAAIKDEFEIDQQGYIENPEFYVYNLRRLRDKRYALFTSIPNITTENKYAFADAGVLSQKIEMIYLDFTNIKFPTSYFDFLIRDIHYSEFLINNKPNLVESFYDRPIPPDHTDNDPQFWFHSTTVEQEPTSPGQPAADPVTYGNLFDRYFGFSFDIFDVSERPDRDIVPFTHAANFFETISGNNRVVMPFEAQGYVKKAKRKDFEVGSFTSQYLFDDSILEKINFNINGNDNFINVRGGYYNQNILSNISTIHRNKFPNLTPEVFSSINSKIEELLIIPAINSLTNYVEKIQDENLKNTVYQYLSIALQDITENPVNPQGGVLISPLSMTAYQVFFRRIKGFNVDPSDKIFAAMRRYLEVLLATYFGGRNFINNDAIQKSFDAYTTTFLNEIIMRCLIIFKVLIAKDPRNTAPFSGAVDDFHYFHMFKFVQQILSKVFLQKATKGGNPVDIFNEEKVKMDYYTSCLKNVQTSSSLYEVMINFINDLNSIISGNLTLQINNQKLFPLIRSKFLLERDTFFLDVPSFMRKVGVLQAKAIVADMLAKFEESDATQKPIYPLDSSYATSKLRTAVLDPDFLRKSGTPLNKILLQDPKNPLNLVRLFCVGVSNGNLDVKGSDINAIFNILVHKINVDSPQNTNPPTQDPNELHDFQFLSQPLSLNKISIDYDVTDPKDLRGINHQSIIVQSVVKALTGFNFSMLTFVDIADGEFSSAFANQVPGIPGAERSFVENVPNTVSSTEYLLSLIVRPKKYEKVIFLAIADTDLSEIKYDPRIRYINHLTNRNFSVDQFYFEVRQ